MRRILLLLALLAPTPAPTPAPAPAQAKWLVAEAEHFRLHEDTSENRIRDRAALLEDHRSLLVSMTNVGEADRAPAPRLNVYILKNIADARPFGKLAPNVAGIDIANSGGSLTGYAGGKARKQWLLTHEGAAGQLQLPQVT